MKVLRFFRAVYHDNNLRRQNRRSLPRDLLRYGRTRLLQPADRLLAARMRCTTQPIGFIVGTPRAGTTLLFQLICRYLDVGYPANAIAPYFASPVIGTWRYLRRVGHDPPSFPLHSTFGGTDGPQAPHEFSWFWQFYTDFRDSDALSEGELDRLPWPTLRAKLEALAGLHARPYVFKSLNQTVYHITRLAREFPQSRFIDLRRDARYVVQSILECRVKRYGSEPIWWSIRPRDVDRWRPRPPLEQVCHQVADIRRAIDAALADLPQHRCCRIDYEALVADPRRVLPEVATLLAASLRAGSDVDSLSLSSANQRRIDRQTFERIPALLEQCR